MLITCLKDLVAFGWKADNGFKVGYLNVLQQNMRKSFPDTDIQATPRIHSKIHVWKRDYGTISSILVGRTGVGWNDSTKIIDATDDVWDAVMKVDKNARTMRHKSWPYYHDWCEIFGKDRATGEQAKDIMDAVNELVNKTTNKDQVTYDIFDDVDDEIKSESDTYRVVDDNVHKKSGGKKRKLIDGNSNLPKILGNFCQNTETRLGEIARRIGYEQDVSIARKEVFEAVRKIGGLTLQDKLLVSTSLAKKPEDLELFSSLPDDAQA